jgi:hypothetical protein
MDEPRDDRIRDVVRHAHETDPEHVDFDVEAGLAEVLERVDPGIPSGPRVSPATADNTIFLCAACHMDEDFADAAAREFLVEPYRAVPPEVAVDSPTVLREVAAVQGRRWIRDGLLIVLMAAAVVLVPWQALVAWLILGAVVGSVAAQPRRRVAFGAVGLAGIAALYLARDSLWPVDRWFVLPPLVALMLAVVLTDEIVTHRRLQWVTWGKRSLPRVRPMPWLLPAAEAAITRPPSLPPDGPAAAVTVARGRRLFVGAGEPREPWYDLFPLGPEPELTVTDLHDQVRARMTPVGDLRIAERVIVDAEGLIDDLAAPYAVDFLRWPDTRPEEWLQPERVRELQTHPLEWARHYTQFQLTTGSGMVVSSFVHMRVHTGHLYVEWRPFVLRPVNGSYRGVRTLSRSPLRPVGQGLLDLVTLPVTAPRRVRRVASLSGKPRSPHPDAYGAGASLRELAAGDDTRNDFQLADEERCLRLLENRFATALTGVLRDHGFSSVVAADEITAVRSRRVADRQEHGKDRGFRTDVVAHQQ